MDNQSTQAAIGFANHFLKTSNDQVIKGLARAYLAALEEIGTLKKQVATMAITSEVRNHGRLDERDTSQGAE